MQTEALISETNTCYARNMAALAARQPALAATVTATTLPDSIVAATGRDGTPSFRLEDAQGRSPSATRRHRWLGGSSMPGISAREIFAGFVSDGRSVILPGVLTGVEPIVLAEKLPAHAAVFVIEEDRIRLKLALCVREYAELISAGRVVFVLSGAENGRAGSLECASGLREFFEAHPGYELPIHLLPVPQKTPEQIAALQTEIEAAGRAIADVHAGVVANLVGRLRRRSRGELPTVPSVAVLGVDPMPGPLGHARRIERALALLNWPHSTCVPDAPQRCHLAARLAAVEQVSADMILLVNTTRGLAGAELPARQAGSAARQAGFVGELPIASWHLPGARHLAPGTVSPGNGQVYFASSLSVYDELIGAGCLPNMIEHCGLAADAVAFRPCDSPRSVRGPDIAVIADLPDSRAEGCNITLDSHVALWRALREVVFRHVSENLTGMSEILMAEAERMSHAAVHEPEIRDQFVRLLQERLVPACRAQAAVEALRAAGHSVGVWGRNWPSMDEVPDVRGGATGKPASPVPDEEALNLIFNTAGVVVIPDPLPVGVQTALDAVAAGAAVACLGGAERFEKEHPCLAAIQACLHLFETTDELLRHVDSLLAASRQGENNVPAGTELIRKEYSVARRLEQIVAAVRRRQTPTGKG